MTVQAGRWRMAGGFVSGGSGARDSLPPTRVTRALGAFMPHTTPTRVRAGLIAILVLACCLAVAVTAVTASVGGGFQSMGQQAAPEVSAATGLSTSLTDMDTEIANVLLVGGTPSLAADRSRDLAYYSSDRTAADSYLQEAAVTASASPAAQRELRAVLDGLGQYEALTADALLADQKPVPAAGHGHSAMQANTAGHANPAALIFYRQATSLMQGTILPRVTALTNSNAAGLNSAYLAGLSASGTGIAVTVGLGLALIAALAGYQLYLAARFRRRVNPALGAATLLAVVVTGYAWGTFGSAEANLRTARFSAFNSIIALSQARAIVYNANADESRWIVDPARSAQYQGDFQNAEQRLAAIGNTTLDSYPAALGSDVSAYESANNHGKVLFGGYLGAEFRNFTFSGEPQAAMAALLAYRTYVLTDQHFRQVAASDPGAATAFDIGTSPGQSDWAFTKLDAALSAVIAVNEHGFATAIAAGENQSGIARDAMVPVAMLLLAGLAFLGVRPRLAEYHPEA